MFSLKSSCLTLKKGWGGGAPRVRLWRDAEDSEERTRADRRERRMNAWVSPVGTAGGP